MHADLALDALQRVVDRLAVAAELIADAKAGYPRLKASRARSSAHPIEEVGSRLRALKPPEQA